MPYSDNLYSALEGESDIEPVGETFTQHGNQGLGVDFQHPQLETRTGFAAHVDSGGPGDVVDVEDPHVFSPTDGYFGTTGGTSPGSLVPASANVPHVPNVLVEDPSLQRSTAAGKAREAEQERLRGGHDNSYTSGYPSLTAPAPRNGPSSAYTTTPIQRSVTPGSQPAAATYYTPSPSSRTPPAATPTSYTTYLTRSSAYHGERFPFLPRDAPPAYTPSPTSPSHAQGLGGPSRNYSTFSNLGDATIDMGRPDETQRLLAHLPESMRDRDRGGSDEESHIWGDRIRRARQHVNWGSFRFVLVGLILLWVTAGFLTSVVTSTRGGTGRHNSPVDEPQPEPDKPNMGYPEVDGDFSWDAALFCKDAHIHRQVQTYAVNFGADKELILQERTSDDDAHRGWGEVHVQGAVILRKAGPDTPDSAVTMEVTVTDERLNVHSSWDADTGSLRVIIPHRVPWSKDRPRACINIKITAWIPQDSTLNLLNIATTHLDITLLDNLSLIVKEGAKLTSTVGTITAGSTSQSQANPPLDTNPPPSSSSVNFHFHSRIIDIRTTAAPITGTWPLYDYLGMQSTAGNIKVSIQPKPDADPAVPKPARLDLKSLSGNVDFREPIYTAASFGDGTDTDNSGVENEMRFPARDYRVDVHTTSGDIRGSVAFSSWAGFRSTSGEIGLEVLPVLDVSLASGDGEGELVTGSKSGGTEVRVLEGLWVDLVRGEYVSTSGSVSVVREGDSGGEEGGRPLRCLHSTHKSTSGDIRLRYPASWEGDISLASLSGSLRAGGEGVKVIKAGSDWPGVNKVLLARKGEEGVGGKVVGKSTSGDVSFWVGEK